MNLSFSQVNKKYKALVVAAMLTVVLAAAQPFLWNMVYSQARELQQKRSQGEQISNVRERNAAIAQSIRKHEELINQLDIVSPPVESRTQVVERLEQLADQHAVPVEITIIQELRNNKDIAASDRIVPVALSVSVTGPVDKLLRYLYAVEHVHELTVVSTWSLTPATQAQSTPAGPVATPVTEAPYQLALDVIFFLRDTSDGGQ